MALQALNMSFELHPLNLSPILSSSNNQTPPPSSTMQSEGLSEDVDTSTLASIVWEHMQRVTINGELKAICKHCNIKLSVKKGIGTRHLLTHVKGCLRKKKKFLPKASQKVMIAKQEPDGKTTSNN
jgi:hypothetical protein